MKELQEMANLILNEDLSYNEDGKRKFKKCSLKFLTKLGKKLELRNIRVDFNPGGIAVSGDAHLIGMWDDEHGVYVSIGQSCAKDCSFMYRTIKHMKDYTGGNNHYIPLDKLDDFDYIGERLIKLK